MDTLVKSFPLSFLLRSVFSGAFFVVSYCVVSSGYVNELKIKSENIFTIALPFALIAGVTVYGIHRSLLYPLFEWCFNSEWAVKQRGVWNTLISENTIKNLVKRWDNKAEDVNQRRYERAKQLEIWADYIHLQFASAWCIILGSVAGAIIRCGHHWHHGHRGHHHWHCLLVSVAFIFFVAACISNWRSHSVEEYADKYLPLPN